MNIALYSNGKRAAMDKEPLRGNPGKSYREGYKAGEEKLKQLQLESLLWEDKDVQTNSK